MTAAVWIRAVFSGRALSVSTKTQRAAKHPVTPKAACDNRMTSLLDPAVMSDGVKLHAVSLELEAAQKQIDDLYARWVELEDKLK